MEKTLSETKEELIRKTESIRHNIEDQISDLKDDAGKIARIAIVAGSVILVTYLIARKLRKNKRPILNGAHYQLAAPPQDPFVVQMIKKYISVFLISVAKQMIAQYLQQLNNKQKVEAHPTKAPGLQEEWT